MKSIFICSMKAVFLCPITTRKHMFFIFIIACLTMLMPSVPEINDWELNTNGLWNDPLHIYENENRVYPPWAIILMIPFYWIHIPGTRLFSTLILAWLAKKNNWTILTFLIMILSPYYIYSLYLCNIDIFVIVLPILLWDLNHSPMVSWVAKGIALPLMLLKPQATFLVIIYLFWTHRNKPLELSIASLIAAIIMIPISFAGSPPLLTQWIDNITHPSPQNTFFWESNNISLTAQFSLMPSALMVLTAAFLIVLWVKHKKLPWSRPQSLSSFLFASILLSPYASQQSVSAAYSFTPSIWCVLFQYAAFASIALSRTCFPNLPNFLNHISLRVFILALITLITYQFPIKKTDCSSI